MKSSIVVFALAPDDFLDRDKLCLVGGREGQPFISCLFINILDELLKSGVLPLQVNIMLYLLDCL